MAATAVFLVTLSLQVLSPPARAAQPVISCMNVTGAVPCLTVQSDLGVSNQIQYCTSLCLRNWAVLTNVLVSQSPYACIDGTASCSAQRFYRVVAIAPTPPGLTGMVLIPAGSFTMGNCFDPVEGLFGELPLHIVTVSAFYMDKFLVTKSLWDDVYSWALTNGYSFDFPGQGKDTNHPAQSMCWYDAVKWCNARSEKEGRAPAYYSDAGLAAPFRTGHVDVQTNWVNWSAGYRLPTEAEWERAARGGVSGHRFSWSDEDTITQDRANYLSAPGCDPYDLGPLDGYDPVFGTGAFPFTSPVGYYPPNDYGLYDMTGNVWEWCGDWYGSYDAGDTTDPRGPGSGPGRILRGGSWDDNACFGRVSSRAQTSPHSTLLWEVGFRCVMPAAR
ncbi:MAG TPA: SUMF1/EgtB/PvdO family nonheme iron enzyme [Candidatus Acidoferrum sp.]|nr:SUMF1/EgtB/PvdO family nonheme iron enzyme [Candidatus Acidoferrum sp.]